MQYLSTKRRKRVHFLLPPSSNHCVEILPFLGKAANLRFSRLRFWQRVGSYIVHDQHSYTHCGYDSITTLRDSAGPKFYNSFSFICPYAGHILLSRFTTKFYQFFNKSLNACCRILLDMFIALWEMVIIRVISFARVDAAIRKEFQLSHSCTLFLLPYRIFSRPVIHVYAVRIPRWLVFQFAHITPLSVPH